MADPWAAFQVVQPQAATDDPWSNFELIQPSNAGMAAGMHAQRGNEKEGEYLADALRTRLQQDKSGVIGNIDAAVRGAAGWVPGMDKIAAAGTAAFGQGQGASFGERYSDNLMRERAMDDADRLQNPYARLGGQVVGLPATAMLMPAVNVAGGAGLAAQTANAAATGAAYGGLSGAVENDGGLAEKMKAAGIGAAAGAGLGAAAPSVIRGVGAGAGMLSSAMQPVTSALRGLAAPEGEAIRRVSAAMQRDGVQNPAAALAEMQGTGAPAIAADVGGETVRALSRSAANNSPEAREALTRVAQERFYGQGDRMADKIGSLGPASAGKTVDEIQAAARAASKPAYAKAYQEGGLGVWNERLAELSQAPAIQEAIKSVVKTGANKTVIDGMPPVKNPFAVDESGMYRILADRKTGNVAYPNLQFWDYVQRDLRGKMDVAYRQGNKDLGNDFRDLRSAILKEADTAVPSFASARQGAAKAFAAEDAMEAGQKFVTSKMKNEDAQKALMRMSAQDRELFAEGFRSDLIAKVRETADRRDVVNAIFGTEGARQRVRIALGPTQSREIEATLRAENAMDMLRGALGNSTTARQLVEMGLAGGAGAGIGYYQGGGGGAVAGALLGAGARKGKLLAENRTANEVGKILASGDAQKIGTLIKTAGKHDSMLRAIKSFEDQVAKIGGMESSGPAQITFGGRVGSNQLPAAADQNDPERKRVR